MQIQSIKNVNMVNFTKETPKEYSLDCKIEQYKSWDNKNMISFSFEKKSFLQFLKDTFFSICDKFNNILKKNDGESTNLHININSDTIDFSTSKENRDETLKTELPKPKYSFPQPNFTDETTNEEKYKYVKSILGYLDCDDEEMRRKAIETIEKYGIDDVNYLTGFGLANSHDDIIQRVLKLYPKYGNSSNVYELITPIRSENHRKLKDETYIEILKTIQELAHLENDSPKEREVVLRPVRRLLNHENEEVRKLAQETIDKINCQPI